jgi:hypothetical protein
MSKLFFDHLIILEGVEDEIKKSATSKEEQEELWGLVDGMVTAKVLDKVLGKLSKDFQDEFLEIFHQNPHDEVKIFGYLRGKAGENIEGVLQKELENIDSDILKEIRPQDEVLNESKVSTR